MRYLEMADRKIGRADRGRNAREPVIRLLDVEHEVAGQQDDQVARCARRLREVSKNYRRTVITARRVR
jgi:hypothetical protein